MWEDSIDINQVTEIRVKTTAFLGVGAISKMSHIADKLAERNIKSVLCVTGGRSYKSSGAWDHVQSACKEKGIAITLYDKVTPNPTTDAIDEATAEGLKAKAGAVITIGGGSPIDAGKSVAILLKNPDKTGEELYTGKFEPLEAAPIIAINLTHGTGSEVNRFAVATITSMDYKPAIAYDCIYPWYAIDDPALMASLPQNQTRYVSIDAINHSIEAATTKTANPLSIELAGQCIHLVAKWLPRALQDLSDLRARYFLAYAAMIAGTSFDNGMLHITHAMEHPLSAIKPELTHGLGLAILLPAVIEAIYPASCGVLAKLLEPIAPGLRDDPADATRAAREVAEWLTKMGSPLTLTSQGFAGTDVEKLTELAQNTPSLGLLLSLAPISVTEEVVRTIYTKSM